MSVASADMQHRVRNCGVARTLESAVAKYDDGIDTRVDPNALLQCVSSLQMDNEKLRGALVRLVLTVDKHMDGEEECGLGDVTLALERAACVVNETKVKS